MTAIESLTVRGKMDGFGAQLMAMLSGIAYCRKWDIQYVHTPVEHLLPEGIFLTDMDDQVDAANAFIDGLMKRLGFPGDVQATHEAPHLHDAINANPDAYYTPEFTQYLAEAYEADSPQPFLEHDFNIAVHVRRGDIIPEETHRWVASADVSERMNRLRAQYDGAHFHVFAWKDPCHELAGDDVTIHCSTSGKDFLDVFHSFVQADVLVIGASCLSMSAALFNTGKVVAPTVNRARTNWADHVLPGRWYE